MSMSTNFGGGMRPGVSMGFGIPPQPEQNPNAGSLGGIAQQTQQQANNPIYGQGSPFQPPPANMESQFVPMMQNFTYGMEPPPVNMEPQPVPMMQNFVGGGLSDPMPYPGMRPGVEKGFGPAPIDGGSMGGKSMGGGMFIPDPRLGFGGSIGYGYDDPMRSNPSQGLGQLVGGPAGKPIFGGNTPQPAAKTRLQDIARPGLDNRASGFSGGLRPAPRNYRPPMRSGGILRQRLR